MTLILGVDPGLAETGYGIIEHHHGASRLVATGTIRTPSTETLARRLLSIHQSLAAVIDAHRPECACVEELFFARNALSVMGVAQARGVILLAASARDIPVLEYTPPQIKQAVTGSGRAEKAQVHRMVEILLGGQGRIANTQPINTTHEADALAIALCHAHAAPLAKTTQAGTANPPARKRTTARK